MPIAQDEVTFSAWSGELWIEQLCRIFGIPQHLPCSPPEDAGGSVREITLDINLTSPHTVAEITVSRFRGVSSVSGYPIRTGRVTADSLLSRTTHGEFVFRQYAQAEGFVRVIVGDTVGVKRVRIQVAVNSECHVVVNRTLGEGDTLRRLSSFNLGELWATPLDRQRTISEVESLAREWCVVHGKCPITVAPPPGVQNGPIRWLDERRHGKIYPQHSLPPNLFEQLDQDSFYSDHAAYTSLGVAIRRSVVDWCQPPAEDRAGAV